MERSVGWAGAAWLIAVLVLPVATGAAIAGYSAGQRPVMAAIVVTCLYAAVVILPSISIGSPAGGMTELEIDPPMRAVLAEPARALLGIAMFWSTPALVAVVAARIAERRARRRGVPLPPAT